MPTTGPASPAPRATGVTTIGVAVLFTAAFALLGAAFDYPGVLDLAPGEILTRYAASDALVRALWYALMIAALGFVPLAVLLGRALRARLPGPTALVALTVTAGVLAGVVQAVGFARWTFAVPGLAATYADPATRAAAVVVEDVLNRFVGGALGEHLGFLLTALWAVGTAVLLSRVAGVPRLLPVAGVLAGLPIATGALEVTGASWPGVPVAVGYAAFAAWLVWIGALVLARRL